MAPRPPEIYGIPISEIARICRVSLKTAARWKAGTTCPPKSACLLLLGDLGCLDSEWAGWRVNRGVLYSPEGWEISVTMIMGVPLMRQMIAAYQAQERKLEAMTGQPEIADWPEWVFEKMA